MEERYLNKDYKYSDLTGKIIGAAMSVHNFLGNGFQEVIYQRALALELAQANLEFQREVEMDIYYKGFQEPIGRRRADFLVAGKVMVEIKALTKLDDAHLAQIINYLEAYKLEVGLLINFGAKSLQFKRTINSKQSAESYQSGKISGHDT